MGFIKDFQVYKRGNVSVYVNQCRNPGKKTKMFTVRRDDNSGCADLLAVIKWSGSWRQYVLQPQHDTQWSSSCLIELCFFLEEMNMKHRQKRSKK